MGQLNLKIFIGKSKSCAFLEDSFFLSCMRDLVLAEPKERMRPALGLSNTMLSWGPTRCATRRLWGQLWDAGCIVTTGHSCLKIQVDTWGRGWLTHAQAEEETLAFDRSLFQARIWDGKQSFLFWKAVLWWEYSSLQRSQSILPARRTQQLFASIEQASLWHLRSCWRQPMSTPLKSHSESSSGSF